MCVKFKLILTHATVKYIHSNFTSFQMCLETTKLHENAKKSTNFRNKNFNCNEHKKNGYYNMKT